MNRDPLGLGVILYGFRVPAGDPVNLTLLASGWHTDGLVVREFELAHESCSISTFCRNPLHPGPCKGWRKKLGVEAPGALKAIKAVESEKLAKRRAAVGEAKSAAAKALNQRQLSSPLHAKKATIKHANVLLGNDEAKASKKADRVILNKSEIKKYSKIKAAHMNSVRTKHGLTEDPGLEDRLAEALAKDNTTGHDENYRAAIGGSAASLGAQLADKHCKKGDGDCDGIPFENLRETLSDAAETALLTGDDSELDTALDDYAAGKTPKASKPPAASTPRPAPEPKPAPKAAPGPEADPTPGAIKAARQQAGKSGEAASKAIAVKDMTKAQYDALSDDDKAWTDATLKEIANAGFGDYTAQDKANASATAAALGVTLQSAEPSAPIKYGTVKASGMQVGDKVMIHLQPETGATQKNKAGVMVKVLGPLDPVGKLVTIKKQNGMFHFEDEDGNTVAWGGVASKWHLSAPPPAKAPNVPAAPKSATANKVAVGDTVQSDGSSGWEVPKGTAVKVGSVIKAKDPASNKTYVTLHDGDGKKVWAGSPNSKIETDGAGAPAAGVPGKASPAPLEGNAAKADTGMKFGLGLLALAKGNKTLGTKAQQKHFADRAQAEMDGDPNAQGVIKFGAEKIAQGMMGKATKHPFAHPTPKISLKEQRVIEGLAAEEIARGIKGDPGPFPVTESLKKAVSAWHAKDYAAMKEATAEFQQHVKAATAKKIGADPNASAAVIAAHILFKPGFNMGDGKAGVRAQVLGEMSSAEYVGLPEGQKVEIKKWLDDRAQHAMDTYDPKLLADTRALQRKLGLPVHGSDDPFMTEGGFGNPPAPAVDLGPAPTAPTPVLPPVPPTSHLAQLKEMFGHDGDPTPNEAIAAVLGMSKANWDQLTPDERATMIMYVDEAKKAKLPGALSADDKVDVYLGQDAADAAHVPVSGAKPATVVVSTSPDAKKASDYATGVVSGIAKQKLAAYEKVSGPEFQQLTTTEQKAILDDLDAIGSKFLDPKKVAQAKSHKDYLSGYTGGGAGAGGATHATAPSGLDKVKAGADTIAEMVDVIGVPNPTMAKATAAHLLSSADTNGNYDQVVIPLADMQASMALDALGKLHTDAAGPLFDVAAVSAIKPELAKDIVKKLHADSGATPVYDAWLKAMKSLSQDDAQGVADAAFPPFGGTFGAATPPTMADKNKIMSAFQDAWLEAGLGAPPAAVPIGSADAEGEVAYALSNGTAGPTHQSWAQQTGEAMGHTMLGGVYKELGLSSAHQASLPNGLEAKALAALKEDFADKLLVGGGGTGAAADLKEALDSAKSAALHAQTNNGWAADSQVLSDLKAGLIQADLEQIVAKYKPVVGNPNLAPPTEPGGAAKLGELYDGVEVLPVHKGILFSAYKSAHKGSVLSHSDEDIYNNLLAVASHYAGTSPTVTINPGEPGYDHYIIPAGLSVLDVAKAVDVQIAQSLGKSNKSVLATKINNWAQTNAGQQYIKDHPKPGQQWVDNLSGHGAGSVEAKAIGLKGTEPVGQRAQRPKFKVPPYDASKTAADFRPITAGEVSSSQAQHMDDTGTNWTPGQAESLANYTTGAYHELNAYLRGKHADGTPVHSISTIGLERIALNQAGMRPLQQDSLLKRGTGWEFLPPEYRSAEGARKLIGKSFVDDAFMSTTAGGEGGNFEDKVLLMIEAPKGTPGAWVREISHNQSENEVVLAAGTKFKILSVDDGFGTTTIRVRVVPS